MTTKPSHKKDARYLAAQLLERVPGAEVKVTSPSGRGTVWWVDARVGRHNVVIEWSPDDGFGLSSTEDSDYNTAASEVFADADDALARIIAVLKAGEPSLLAGRCTCNDSASIARSRRRRSQT
jgi:hypothetical protein